MKIKWFYLAGLSTILIVVIAVTAFFVLSKQDRPISNSIDPTPALLYMEALEQRVYDPAVDAQGRQSLVEKIELYQHAQMYQSAGAAAPAVKDPASVAFPPSAERIDDGGFPSDIFPGSDGMVKPDEATIQNYLQRKAEDGSILALFAGSTAQNPEKGLIIFVLINPSQEVEEYIHYPHEANAGALTILEDRGNWIKLQAENGTIWYFDVTLRFFTQEDPFRDRMSNPGELPNI